MRLIYLGSGEFGIPTLEALAAVHEIPLVVSQPDRPAGRGGKTRPTPIKARATELGLTVETPEKPNSPEFEQRLRELEPELAVVVAYGHLIRKNLLDVPEHGFVNLHASILPAYRGAAPVPWAILNGEAESGATVFQLDERFDTGAILGTIRLPIRDDDTSATYLAALAPKGAELMAEVVRDIEAGRKTPQPQDNAQASAAPKFRKDDGRIDWSQPYAVIERKVRALQPWPLASTTLPGAKGEIRLNVLTLAPAEMNAGGKAPGAVLAADPKGGLVVATGDGTARLALIQPEGKRPMPDTEFLRGSKVVVS